MEGTQKCWSPFPPPPGEALGNPHIIFSKNIDPMSCDQRGHQTHAGIKDKVEHILGAIPTSGLKESRTELEVGSMDLK